MIPYSEADPKGGWGKRAIAFPIDPEVELLSSYA